VQVSLLFHLIKGDRHLTPTVAPTEEATAVYRRNHGVWAEAKLFAMLTSGTIPIA